MPLHGKIVVIKRSGGDGTEFPLTATCLFGRRPDCDIRIQLPQVSKEHCRIDLNENKEIVLTNLSSVNPTRVNGEALQQSERLKHGDVITIIDRSFRFEYPPAPTPKKRSSRGGKTETFKVLQDQQVGDTLPTETDKRITEVSTDPHLKDGTNHDNIQRSLEKTVEVESKQDDGLLQSKTASPFNDLYQMIKKSLDVKTPRKSSASVLQTPTSRFCTPKPDSVRKPVISTEDTSTPKKEEVKVAPVAEEMKGAENVSDGTPKSVKKQRPSFQTPSTEMARPEAENAAKSEATSPQKRIRTPPKRFTACEVVEQGSAKVPKSPVRRRSKEATPAVTSPKTNGLRKTSPRNSGKVEKVKETSKKRKSGEVVSDSPTQQIKKKRVSFGGSLCPELFDKRMPPDSPLRKGAAPRRSLCVPRTKQSLLRRASVIGLLEEFEQEHPGSPAKMRTPSPKMSSRAKNASPKTPTPAKKSPKSRTPSPKAAAKSKSPSPARGRTPGDQTPNVQGRFSVSRINTPSPITEDAVTDQVLLFPVTPKIPVRRMSTSRETANMTQSATKVMRRRSGISRASMKVKNSWADIVRFGPTKPQVVAPAKKVVIKKTTKKTVSKPQTLARKFTGHVSTGHADSPVTIVVGRAHRQKCAQTTGAAPRLVPNIALLKKNMKMDEDLTGISEMLKTPAVERKRSVINENDVTKTPVGGLGISVVEPSVLNTPEEPGEMMVSPLTVKDRRYNSEFVQRLLNDDQESSFVSDTPASESHSGCSEQQAAATTPKQKPELPECLTGVKRLMKTPRQKSEPVEDLRGKILITPKQKPEQRECLTGVKRLMKTPRQKSEPVEDFRGKILITPKQKPEQRECLTGVKRMMETPRQEAEPAEDVRVELLTTPTQKPEQQERLTDVKVISKTPQQEAEPLEDLQEKLLETPKAVEAGDASMDDVKETPVLLQESEDVCETPDVKLVEEPLTEGQVETNEVQGQTSPDCDEDAAKELVFVHEEPRDDVPEVELEKETVINEVVADAHLEEVQSGHDDKETSDAVETISQASVDEKVSEEQPKAETMDTDPEPEKKSVRGRKAKLVEPKPADKQEATENSEDAVVPAPVRGRRVKKTEATAPPAVRQTTTRGRNAKPQESLDAELAIEKSAPLPSKVALKPKRGRNGKKASEDQAEAEEVSAETEIVPEPESEQSPPVDVDQEANDSSARLEKAVLKPKRGRRAKQPEQDVHQDETEVCSDQLEVLSSDATGPVPQETVTKSLPEAEAATCEVTDAAIVQKKSVRGRKAKLVESKSADDKQEVVEHSEDPAVPAPVRGRRGKKASSVQENDSAPPAEEAVVKPVRGRKTKQTPVEPLQPEPEKSEVVSDEPLATDAQPQIPAVGKPKRGRKTKPDAVEENEVVEDAVVAVETKQQSQPPVRAKRGRNAKQEEEKPESVETTKPQEPAKKMRRTRKAEKDLVEPREEEVQAVETVVPEEAEAPIVAEPVKMEEQATVAAKPKRGGRKAKQDPESQTPVESTEVQELPVVSATDKLKRGRKGKRVTEEVDVTAVVSEEKPDQEAEEKNNTEPEAPVSKPSRARGAKKEVSQAIPAKRARRGAAAPLEEASAESTALVSEPASTSVEPAKKGRRAAAKPKADEATMTSDQAEPTEDSSSAVDTKTSKRSIKWKPELEVFEIPRATPVKAVRGRKTKVGGKVDAESKTVLKDAGKTEEKDLSDKVAEAQPVKRGRRGAKVADVTADEAESTSKVQSAEADPQLKTRRGRSAKK